MEGGWAVEVGAPQITEAAAYYSALHLKCRSVDTRKAEVAVCGSRVTQAWEQRMSDDANDDLPFCVFIDTEAYRKAKFDWTGRNFKSLRKRVQAGSIELVTTDILKREVHHGIRDVLTEFMQSVKQANRNAGVLHVLGDARVAAMLSLATDAPAYEKLCAEADTFFLEVQAVVAEPPPTALQEVFELYFSGAGPFGSGRKKCEFPDAANAIILSHYAQVIGTKIIIVSGDLDWKKTCENHPAFIHKSHISQMLDMAIRAEWQSSEHFPSDELLTRMKAQEADLKRMLEIALTSASRVNLGDGNVDNLNLDQVYLESFSATDIWDADKEIHITGDLFHSSNYSAVISIEDDEMMNALEHEVQGSAELIARLDVAVPLNESGPIRIVNVDYDDGLELEVPLKY
jgi:hypothetical protein